MNISFGSSMALNIKNAEVEQLAQEVVRTVAEGLDVVNSIEVS